ncbi:F-box protein At5g49610-like [Spinacia oleracea]|uniref:F-box protein At5g49610-like n=1 Tax=Spinacia oleracea TaxID=3562 RepID=A0A9R0J3B2_SPIOL|nr:F-box protein At5g49610-like [Spinacia oleracea]
MTKTNVEKEMENAASSSSADYGVSFPDDLTIEILVRLPIKSLLRFKSVCKNWYSLFKNPSFTKSQFQFSTKLYLSSSHLVIRSDDTLFSLHLDLNLNYIHDKNTKEIKRKFVPMPTEFFNTSVKNPFQCLGSCNGILCIQVSGTKSIYLWNPTINEYRVIPLPLSYFSGGHLCLSGFGYAAAINDYKIVLVDEHKSKLKKGKFVYVYSSRCNKWKEFDFPSILNLTDIYCGYRCRDRDMEAVLLNDSLHWVTDPYEYEPYILKFDMVNETLDLKKIREMERYRKQS